MKSTAQATRGEDQDAWSDFFATALRLSGLAVQRAAEREAAGGKPQPDRIAAHSLGDHASTHREDFNV